MSIRISKSKLGNAWMNSVWDYEDNVLGGRTVSYPNDETLNAQKKDRYGLTYCPENPNYVVFNSEKDYMWFVMRWS